MKILKKDLKRGRIVVSVQNLDDLWHLSQVIDKGDLVSSKTTRKIKSGEKEQATKKTMTLELAAEETDFTNNTLRVRGKTTQESEEIPKGSHHTLTLEEGSQPTITKGWRRYQLERLEQATKKQEKVIILVLDREEAVFALLKSKGYEILAEMKGKVAKKAMKTVTGNFYKELTEKLNSYNDRYKPSTIILGSPAFWKEDLMEELNGSEISKKIVLATCSSVGANAIEEILKRSELKSVLKQQRAAEEAKYVDELMLQISKDALAAYGKKEVDNAINSGNVKALLITDAFIRKHRKSSEQLMKNAEVVKGDVLIINSENESGKKLDSLGGVAVLLRYKAYRS